MLPWQFWNLTPAELDDLVEGYRERDYREWERAAWIVSHLLKPHLKKGRTLASTDLLPKRDHRKPVT